MSASAPPLRQHEACIVKEALEQSKETEMDYFGLPKNAGKTALPGSLLLTDPIIRSTARADMAHMKRKQAQLR
jgi:hypothetical protein